MVMHIGDTIKRDRSGSSPETPTLQGAIATSRTEAAAPPSSPRTPSSTAAQTQTPISKLHERYPATIRG